MFLLLSSRYLRGLTRTIPSPRRRLTSILQSVGYLEHEKPLLFSAISRKMSSRSREDPAVSNFREYLRIETVQPEPDYAGANEFLVRMAKELKLPYRRIVTNTDPLREVFLITWQGTQPELPSVLLNSHIDVVPVFPEHWKYEPFAAHKDDNGVIFGRGTQDMKCVGIQYIEAIRNLLKAKEQFPRTMHLCFVPDEEIGGHLGMEKFVRMQEFKDLNVGFVLDEGLANPTSAFTVFYGERSPWWVMVRCPGDPGHGSRFIENNAGQKIRKVIDRFMAFRDQEEKKLKSNSDLRLGDVTTVNLTKLEGGVQMNVVPAELSVGFDIRITPTTKLDEFEKQLRQWCSEAGQDVTIEFKQKYSGENITNATSQSPWWRAFSEACGKAEITIEKEIFPAATDSRYIRAAGYPAIGFSPMNNTEILLHDHNEYLSENVFLRGISIYEKILPAVASVPDFDPSSVPSANQKS